MSKFYISEEELRKIYDSQFAQEFKVFEERGFEEFLEWYLEEGEIELVEFDHYEVSKLDYKPIVKVKGTKDVNSLKDNGNIYNLTSMANRVLCGCGKEEKGYELCERILSYASNFDEALSIIREYVEVY